MTNNFIMSSRYCATSRNKSKYVFHVEIVMKRRGLDLLLVPRASSPDVAHTASIPSSPGRCLKGLEVLFNRMPKMLLENLELLEALVDTLMPASDLFLKNAHLLSVVFIWHDDGVALSRISSISLCFFACCRKHGSDPLSANARACHQNDKDAIFNLSVFNARNAKRNEPWKIAVILFAHGFMSR